MYIDKIYTKLYSDKDWNGLSQLVNEIKSFARKDYEGLTPDEASKLRENRNKVAQEMRRRRDAANIPVTEEEAFWANNKMNIPTDSWMGQMASQVNDEFSPMTMQKKRQAARENYMNNLGKNLDEITDMSNKLRSDAVARHNSAITDRYQNQQFEINPFPEMNPWQKLRNRFNPMYEPDSHKKIREDNWKVIRENVAKDPNVIRNEPSKMYWDQWDYPSYMRY